MKEKILEFLLSSEKSLNFEIMYPISDIENALVEIGFSGFNLSGDETNGWQVDFWYYTTHPEFGKYCLSGSLWYGDFVLTVE